MIVQRMTWVAKPGRRSKMVQILQELWKLEDHPPTHRIYLPITGPYDVIHQEIEFEDFEAREKFWAEHKSKPEFAAMLKKWQELRDSGESSELLRLVE